MYSLCLFCSPSLDLPLFSILITLYLPHIQSSKDAEYSNEIYVVYHKYCYHNSRTNTFDYVCLFFMGPSKRAYKTQTNSTPQVHFGHQSVEEISAVLCKKNRMLIDVTGSPFQLFFITMITTRRLIDVAMRRHKNIFSYCFSIFVDRLCQIVVLIGKSCETYFILGGTQHVLFGQRYLQKQFGYLCLYGRAVKTIGGTIVKDLIDIIKSCERPELNYMQLYAKLLSNQAIRQFSRQSRCSSTYYIHRKQFLAGFSRVSRTQMGGQIFVGYNPSEASIRGSSGRGRVALLGVQ